jgi:putative ABC transport system substrate-binding protein
MVSSTT